jgi:hypothetical protein
MGPIGATGATGVMGPVGATGSGIVQNISGSLIVKINGFTQNSTATNTTSSLLKIDFDNSIFDTSGLIGFNVVSKIIQPINTGPVNCLQWTGSDTIQFNFNSCLIGNIGDNSGNPIDPFTLSNATFSGAFIYAFIIPGNDPEGIPRQEFATTIGINNYLTNDSSGVSGTYRSTISFNGFLNSGDYIALTGCVNSVFNNLPAASPGPYSFTVIGNSYPFQIANTSTVTFTFMKNI